MFILEGYVCGDLIPEEIACTVGQVYNVLLIAIPIIIVLFGIIDLVKAVASGKEDDIKKGTTILIRRIITGLIVFFVLAVVKFVVNLIQTNNTENVSSCLNEIFGNTCSK